MKIYPATINLQKQRKSGGIEAVYKKNSYVAWEVLKFWFATHWL